MSDTSDPNSDDRNKGFHIDKKRFSLHSVPSARRQSYRKESKTIKEENKITTNTIENRRNFKFGGNGRRQSALTKYSNLKVHYKLEALKYVIRAYGIGRRAYSRRKPRKNI